jgi:MFS family permease
MRRTDRRPQSARLVGDIASQASQDVASGAAIAAAIWGIERRNLTIGLLLTVSMAAFEALAVATVLPAAVRDIGGLDWYGWVFSGFMLANLVSITTSGRAADQRGVARPFILGSGLFVAGLLGAGLAPAMPLVVASRIAQGLGAGAISSVAYIAIARAYPVGARPRMLAMLSSAWVVPGLIGPALAGTVADHASWRWVFLGLAPPTLLASALAVPSLRRLAPSAAAATDTNHTLTAMALAAGTGAALFGLGCREWRLAAATLVVGIAVALPALIRLLPAGTLRARHGLPAAIATVGLLGFAFFAAEAFLPLSLTEVRGQSTTISGLALTAATLTWTTGAWIQVRLAGHESRRRLTAGGLVLIIGGVVGIAVVIMTTVPVAFAAIAWGVAGLGMGLAFSTTTLVVLESAPSGEEGLWSSAAQLANVLGTALGTGIGGAIVALVTASAANSMRSGVVAVDAAGIGVAMVALLAARRLPAAPRA